MAGILQQQPSEKQEEMGGNKWPGFGKTE